MNPSQDHSLQPETDAPQSVSAFFNSLSVAYDGQILRGCPPYEEMLKALISYSTLSATVPLNLLELGCGTGNLTALLMKAFPQAQVTVVDLSENMLAETRQKLAPFAHRLQCVEAGFLTVAFEEGPGFDGVFSSLAIHHLTHPDKAQLYHKIYQWLVPGGRFMCADQCLALPESEAYALDRATWRSWCTENGASQEELAMWETHAQELDHYAALANHFQWLQAAGFESVDAYWRKLFWTVYGGRKPQKAA